MQALSAVCIGLLFLPNLAAQAAVPREQCLGGTLVAIGQNSISLQFNKQIMTVTLAPDAEIWRRGADLQNLQFVLGDEIYLECTRDSASGAALAKVVAAVENGDAVRMEPHHLAEYRVCGGRLIAVAKETISVKSDGGVCVMHINASTTIWRGEMLPDTSRLKLGDMVDARSVVSYPSGELIAEEVDANLANTEGTIVTVLPDRIVVNQYPGADKHSGSLRGQVTVLFDARTKFDFYGGELNKGRMVRAVGLALGHDKFRASTIVVEK